MVLSETLGSSRALWRLERRVLIDSPALRLVVFIVDIAQLRPSGGDDDQRQDQQNGCGLFCEHGYGLTVQVVSEQ